MSRAADHVATGRPLAVIALTPEVAMAAATS